MKHWEKDNYNYNWSKTGTERNIGEKKDNYWLQGRQLQLQGAHLYSSNGAICWKKWEMEKMEIDNAEDNDGEEKSKANSAKDNDGKDKSNQWSYKLPIPPGFAQYQIGKGGLISHPKNRRMLAILTWLNFQKWQFQCKDDSLNTWVDVLGFIWMCFGGNAAAFKHAPFCHHSCSFTKQ